LLFSVNLRRYTPVPVFPPEVHRPPEVEQAEAAEEVNEAEQVEGAGQAEQTERAAPAEATGAAPCLDLEDVCKMSADVLAKSGDVVGLCRWTVSNPVLKAPMVSVRA
jgi:hypothetical protein